MRVGVMWRAVEPAPLQYNHTYLEIMRELVDSLGAAGIYSLIDSHQDDMSRKFCGEGFPDFAAMPAPWASKGGDYSFPAPLPLNITTASDGYPNLTECQEVAATFNTTGSILGYEILNEPWFGNVYQDPLRPLEPGAADREVLAPLYEQVYSAIRGYDNSSIVFYEPSVHEAYLLQPTGFVNGPGGPAHNDKQAFAYHIYCPSHNASGDTADVPFCKNVSSWMWDVAMEDVKRVGGGSLMTEFGSVGYHETSLELLNYQLDLADQNLQSWMYWKFKDFEDITTQNRVSSPLYDREGNLQTAKVATLSRTYAPIIAGIASSIEVSFNSTTKYFSLSYELNPSIPAEFRYTEIYYNQALVYPSGIALKVYPENEVKILYPERNRVRVVHAAENASNFTVTLRPKV